MKTNLSFRAETLPIVSKAESRINARLEAIASRPLFSPLDIPVKAERPNVDFGAIVLALVVDLVAASFAGIFSLNTSD